MDKPTPNLTKYIILNKTYYLYVLYLDKDKKYPLGWVGGIYKTLFTDKNGIETTPISS